MKFNLLFSSIMSVWFATVAPGAAATTPGISGVHEILGRMDQAAGQFRGMTAAITRLNHTAVLNDDSTETGTLSMRKTGPHQVEGLIDIAEPDRKAYAIDSHTVQIYYPNMKTVEIYNVGRQGEQLNQFLMIGFGTSGADLAKSYEVRVLATEPLPNGEKATGISLVPKSGEARKLIKNVELWIPEHSAYPVKEKILQPSGDYTVVNYKDLQINPALSPDAVQLKLPSGVKKVYPQK